MSRLPIPSSDNNVWGDILNDYLSQELRSDGSLKKVNYFSSAGKTSVSDADFTTAPPNGALATVRNSTDDTTRFFMRTNGTWEEVTSSSTNELPTGGTTGQVLAKNSNTDFDVEWADAASGGDFSLAKEGE